MKSIKIFFFIFIFLILFSYGEGKTYYVHPLKGDDNLEGSEKSPWKTLEKVKNSTEKGDIIYLLDFDEKWGWSIYDWPSERIYYSKKLYNME